MTDGDRQHPNNKAILTPPGTEPEPFNQPTGSSRPAILILTGAAAAVLVSVALFLLISPLRHEKVTASHDTGRPGSEGTVDQPPPSPPENTEEHALNRKKAAAALEAFLLLKTQAENHQISIWSKRDYTQILDLETEADQLFSTEQYLQAAQIYEDAAERLKTLLGTRPERIATALETGEQFLQQENIEQAREAFQLALAMDPESETAQQGLTRTDRLAAILKLYDLALEREAAGELEEASASLQQILELDPNYQQGREASARVSARLGEKKYQQILQQFYDKLENGTLEEARATFESLNKSYGEQTELSVAETLLNQAEEAALLTKLKKRVEKFETEEKWHEAVKVYDDILATAPDTLFASHGREIAIKRRELDDSLKVLLDKPERLSNDLQLLSAKHLLEYAQQFVPATPRLSSQINQLKELIAYVTTEVSVRLESDNLTDIVIYHVGGLGTFTAKTITLRPGTYTIVGSRNGYRDIRRVVEITPDTKVNRFYIACGEPI